MKLAVDFILIGGIFITLLILFLLIKSNKKMLPQKLLILFFTMLLFYLLHGYADIHEISILFVITFIFNDCVEVFLGPLIFIYIKSLFEENKTLMTKNWVHFIPTIFIIVVFSVPFLVSILLDKYLFDYLKYFNENSLAVFIILTLYLITYLLLSLQLFYKYRKAMSLNYSTIGNNDFNWVKKMLVGTLIVAGIDVLISIYEFFTEEFSWNSQYVTALLVIILIGYLGFYGVNQSKVLLPNFLIQDTPSINKSTDKIDPLSSFTVTEIKDLQTRLEKVLITSKPYLDEELTLGKLAHMIDTTDKKLSAILNQQMNTTFYDLINTYRVDTVKEKLNSGDFENLTLLGIAYESGFKSKTSFNRIFKRETGLSPSAYKQMLNAKIKV